MKLLCPDCGAVIAAADANVDTGIAKCAACGGVVNVFQALGLPNPAASAPAPPPEEVLARPARMKVEDQSPAVWSVHWRWFSPKYIFLIFFCIFWDGFLIFWYAMGLRHVTMVSLVFLLFPLLHVAVGVGLTYSVIAGFLNTTRLTLDNLNLTIRHGPMPWRGNRVLPIQTIGQLYCKHKHQSKGGDTFELWAAPKEGAPLRLLSLDDQDEARFLKQQMERELGIAPQHVA